MNSFLDFFSSNRGYGGLQEGSKRRARGTTYEQRRDEILKKNRSLKRLRDKLTPEELAEVEARERPFFEDLIKKGQPKDYQFSLGSFLDPFGFASKTKGDATEAKVSSTAFSLTSDTYAGPNYVGLKMADSGYIPGKKDFSVLVPNSTAYASRLHDLMFTLIGGVRDKEKREELRKLTNQYYSSQLAQGLQRKNKEDVGTLADRYVRFLNNRGSSASFDQFIQEEVYSDPRLSYFVKQALQSPGGSILEQQLKNDFLALKRTRSTAAKQKLEETFNKLNKTIENQLSTAKVPTEGDPGELTQAFYQDKSLGNLYDYENLDLIYSGLVKAADESLFTDDVESLELAAKLIFERNKGNEINYMNLSREQIDGLLEILRNEGDNRLFQLAEKYTTEDVVEGDISLAGEILTQEAEENIVEQLETEQQAEAAETNQTEAAETNQAVESQVASSSGAITNAEAQAISLGVSAPAATEEDFEVDYPKLIDINLLQGDNSIGDNSIGDTFEELQQSFTSGRVNEEQLRSYIFNQPLSRIQQLINRNR